MNCDKCGGRTDRPGPWECDNSIHPEPTIAQKIVAAIESDIYDRRGLRQEFDAIDEETQYEIRDAWAEIIETILNKEKVKT